MQRSEPVVWTEIRDELDVRTLTAIVLTIGCMALLYKSPGFIFSVALLVALVVIAAARPFAPLVVLPASLGLIYRLIHIRGLEFNPAEIILITTCMGIGVRTSVVLVVTRCRDLSHNVRCVLSSLRRGFGPTAIALVLVGTLSLLTVADPAHRHESIRLYRWVIVEPVLYFLIVRWYAREERDRRLVAISYVAGGALVSAYALIQFARGAGLTVEGVVRISGTFPHPNALALYLDRLVPFAAALVLARRRWIDYRWLPAALLCAVALVLTYSRGALIGAGVAVVLAAWLLGRRHIAAAAAITGVIGGGALVLAAGSRLLSLFSGGSGSARIEIWRSALAMGRDHPIFGVGLDQFLYQYTPRYIAPAAWPERFTSHPHNILLDVWLSLGIMGLIVAMAYAVVLIRRARRVVDQRRVIGLAALVALVASLVHGVVDNAYFLPGLALAFWFLTALVELESRPSGDSTLDLDQSLGR